MSNDREFDRYAQELLDFSMQRDEGQTDEEWLARFKRLTRLIYRAGANTGLTYRFSQVPEDDTLARVRWLVDHDFFSADVKALLLAAESRHEQDQAFTGTYGLTESELHSMLAEGFHTAFRKASDHPYATTIHQLIKDLPGEEWGAVISFVTDPIIGWLRQAEARQQEKETPS